MTYDPNSDDAMFSRVMSRLDAQDLTLREILTEVRKTNGRVTSLEQTRVVNRAQAVLIAAGVSAVIGCVGWAGSMVIGLLDK